MSRRFGRNQKRRMREELAAKQERVANLETGMAMDRGLLRDQSEKLSNLKEMMGEFAERVGRYAIAEGVPTMFDADWLMRKQSFGMSIEMGVPSFAYHGAMLDSYRVHDEVMRILDVEVVRNHMARNMHCRLQFDGHQIGYAISDHALVGMTSDELARRITPEVVRMLMLELKRAGIR